MPSPYPIDLRIAALEALESGASARKVAADLNISKTTVGNWQALLERTDALYHQIPSGAQKSKLRGERAWILSRLAQHPDITIAELHGELAKRGLSVGYGTVWRFLACEGLSRWQRRRRAKRQSACRAR